MNPVNVREGEPILLQKKNFLQPHVQNKIQNLALYGSNNIVGLTEMGEYIPINSQLPPFDSQEQLSNYLGATLLVLTQDQDSDAYWVSSCVRGLGGGNKGSSSSKPKTNQKKPASSTKEQDFRKDLKEEIEAVGNFFIEDEAKKIRLDKICLIIDELLKDKERYKDLLLQCFFFAVQYHALPVIYKLVEKGQVADGVVIVSIIVHWKAMRGDGIKSIRYLLEHGTSFKANVSTLNSKEDKGKYSECVLTEVIKVKYELACCEREKVLQLLLDKGANPDGYIPGEYLLEKVLNEGFERSDRDRLALLLVEKGATVTQKAFDLSRTTQVYKTTQKLFIEKGFKCEDVNYWCSVIDCVPEYIPALLEQNADNGVILRSGECLFRAYLKKAEWFKYLLSKGASFDLIKENPKYLFEVRKKPECLRYFLSEGAKFGDYIEKGALCDDFYENPEIHEAIKKEMLEKSQFLEMLQNISSKLIRSLQGNLYASLEESERLKDVENAIIESLVSVNTFYYLYMKKNSQDTKILAREQAMLECVSKKIFELLSSSFYFNFEKKTLRSKEIVQELVDSMVFLEKIEEAAKLEENKKAWEQHQAETKAAEERRIAQARVCELLQGIQATEAERLKREAEHQKNQLAEAERLRREVFKVGLQLYDI
jgi:hypothetical protein